MRNLNNSSMKLVSCQWNANLHAITELSKANDAAWEMVCMAKLITVKHMTQNWALIQVLLPINEAKMWSSKETASHVHPLFWKQICHACCAINFVKESESDLKNPAKCWFGRPKENLTHAGLNVLKEKQWASWKSHFGETVTLSLSVCDSLFKQRLQHPFVQTKTYLTG